MTGRRFISGTQARWDKTHQTHHSCAKHLTPLQFRQVSLQTQARDRRMTEVSLVSLVSLVHSGLNPARVFRAARWRVHWPRLRATTSAQSGADRRVVRHCRNPSTPAVTSAG